MHEATRRGFFDALSKYAETELDALLAAQQQQDRERELVLRALADASRVAKKSARAMPPELKTPARVLGAAGPTLERRYIEEKTSAVTKTPMDVKLTGGTVNMDLPSNEAARMLGGEEAMEEFRRRQLQAAATGALIAAPLGPVGVAIGAPVAAAMGERKYIRELQNPEEEKAAAGKPEWRPRVSAVNFPADETTQIQRGEIRELNREAEPKYVRGHGFTTQSAVQGSKGVPPG